MVISCSLFNLSSFFYVKLIVLNNHYRVVSSISCWQSSIYSCFIFDNMLLKLVKLKKEKGVWRVFTGCKSDANFLNSEDSSSLLKWGSYCGFWCTFIYEFWSFILLFCRPAIFVWSHELVMQILEVQIVWKVKVNYRFSSALGFKLVRINFVTSCCFPRLLHLILAIMVVNCYYY